MAQKARNLSLARWSSCSKLRDLSQALRSGAPLAITPSGAGPPMRRRLSAPQPLGWPTRVLFLVAAASLTGLLGVARRLEPDPRGLGTHRQLGLRSCAFLELTGRPCPTCGMTTSFAWATQGRLDRAWQANPAGCLFALAAVPLVVWLVWSASANEPVGFPSVTRPVSYLLVGAVVLSLVFWLIRLIVSSAALLSDPAP